MSESKTGKRIYLASPYTDKSEIIMADRFEAVCKKAAELMARGYIVFCPIAHSHPIAQCLPTNYITDFDFWMGQDLDYIKLWADEVWVYKLSGWTDSKGVAKEMNLAYELNKPVIFT